MIVVDASALLEFLFHTAAGKAVEDRLFESGQTLHAPHLVDIEVTHVIRRYAGKGDIDGHLPQQHGSRRLADLPLRRYPHNFLLPRIWELRNNLTAYDAAYVALAEVLTAPLLTRDGRLAAAAGHRAQIELE